jgi:succinate dehydrogenase hydrophobic anchor subunit
MSAVLLSYLNILLNVFPEISFNKFSSNLFSHMLSRHLYTSSRHGVQGNRTVWYSARELEWTLADY